MPGPLLPPTAAFACGSAERENDPALGPPIPLPKLFRAYMQLGARVISLPALDRDFGTIDFLVIADNRCVNMSSMGLRE